MSKSITELCELGVQVVDLRLRDRRRQLGKGALGLFLSIESGQACAPSMHDSNSRR